MLEPVHFIPAIALWLAIIIIVPALFYTACKIVFVFCAIAGAILLLFSAIDCYIKYKSIKTALLAVVIIPVQIFGYGMGFTTALIRRVLFKKGEFTGFTKRYYQ